MNNNIPVITDRKALYDKCENMEQLFDKYYLPLLDKHYSKVYQLQQENQILKERINKIEKHVSSLSSVGRGCEIYADVKKEILKVVRGDNK